MPIELGMFLTPATKPGRPMAEIIDWNLDVIRKAEEVGYREIWIGSHITSHYSPIACPQQVIARALGETSRITLGTGVEILYQNHPVTVAAQLAQLDHMARGRLHFGFGAGATPSDHVMFGVDGPTTHAMLLEALAIILQCWSESGPQEFHGTDTTRRRRRRGQKPRLAPPLRHEPRIAFAGSRQKSPRSQPAARLHPDELNFSRRPSWSSGGERGGGGRVANRALAVLRIFADTTPRRRAVREASVDSERVLRRSPSAQRHPVYRRSDIDQTAGSTASWTPRFAGGPHGG